MIQKGISIDNFKLVDENSSGFGLILINNDKGHIGYLVLEKSNQTKKLIKDEINKLLHQIESIVPMSIKIKNYHIDLDSYTDQQLKGAIQTLHSIYHMC